MSKTIMEKIPVQLTKDNIEYIKRTSSFAKIINTLIQEMRTDEKLEDKILTRISTLS